MPMRRPKGDNNPEAVCILAVDDERAVTETYSTVLESEGHKVIVARAGHEVIDKVKEHRVDLVLLDMRLPDIDGGRVLRKLSALYPNLPVIIVTAYGNIPSAVEMIRLGAYDYIEKPFDIDELMTIINRGLEKAKLVNQNSKLRQQMKSRYDFDHLIGKSHQMSKVVTLAQQLAHTTTTVLLLGETGTGKELIAKAIHYWGPRSEYPFVPVNCASLTESLLDSELFGYVKGAFTGAAKDKKGLFHAAGKGTIFLDEVGALTLDFQAKLLRVLQEHEIRPVGATKCFKIEARVIAGTNKDLEAAVEEGSFRKDVYYRLNVIPIILPPLRDRKQDIPLIAAFFLKRFCEEHRKVIKAISLDAMRWLCEQIWPGNIRELENVIHRGVIVCQHHILSSDDLSGTVSIKREGEPESILSWDQLRKQQLIKAYKKAKFNKVKTATLLGISVRHLYRLIEKYRIE